MVCSSTEVNATSENAENCSNKCTREYGQCKKIYMDYNATTPLAPTVVSEITEALTTLWANPSSKSSSGIEANRAINKARGNLQKMLNGSDPSEIVFMSGGTEANNHVIWNSIKYFKEFVSSAEQHSIMDSKPHIISSVIEHDSMLNVLKKLEEENIIDVTFTSISVSLGSVDPEEIINSIRDETVLVTIMLANNETGIIQPINDICYRIKEANKSRASNLPKIFVHTDAAQAIGKIKVDVKEMGVDYMTIVGHKFYGPRIGALWIHSQCPLFTMLHGGGQENGKRAGTENTCMIVGLGEAARLVAENIDQYRDNLSSVRKYFRQKLIDTFGENVTFNTPSENTLPNTLNISFDGQHLRGQRVLNNCKYLEASVGAACHSHLGDKPSHILIAHGIPYKTAENAIRLSLGRETSTHDVDIVLEDLKMSVETNQQIMQ